MTDCCLATMATSLQLGSAESIGLLERKKETMKNLVLTVFFAASALVAQNGGQSSAPGGSTPGGSSSQTGASTPGGNSGSNSGHSGANGGASGANNDSATGSSGSSSKSSKKQKNNRNHSDTSGSSSTRENPDGNATTPR